jgi:predicted membrane-bound spermidine synthase
MRNNAQTVNRAVLPCVLLISLSLFAYQVSLTRLYSAILSHHYVFFTTSFAILGVGIGSVVAYKHRIRLDRIIGADSLLTRKLAISVNKWAFALSCAFACVFVLIYTQPFIDNLVIYIILGIIPFVFSGYFFSMLFRACPQISGKLYFADLAGAGAGSILIVLFLDHLGMFRTVVLICLLPLIAAAVLPGGGKLKLVQYLLSAILAIGMFLPAQTVTMIETNFYALLNNTGKTYGEMQRSGLEPEIVFSRWDSFARTDLIEMEDMPQVRILTIDGSANAPMYAFDGNAGNLDHFKPNAGFIPFAIAESNDTLIIGAGGGRGVLYALAAGSQNISAVEINPASIEAVRSSGEFNGFIFDRPEVRVYTQDGRNFARTTQEQFDVIFLSLVVTNTTQGVGFALSENYVHTVQAMDDYLRLLSGNGRIAFVAHDQTSLIRLTTTAMQTLAGRGILLRETPDYIAMFYQLADVGTGNVQMVAPVIIIKNRPFSEQESAILEQELLDSALVPMHIPHLREWDALDQIKREQLFFNDFIDSFDERVYPVNDNSPYFFHFERGIPSVLLYVLLFSLLGTFLLTATGARKKENLRASAYFGLLGMGFMMIQIPLIQMFILYLGHPTLAFSYILAAMLLGCGIGGFLNSCKAFRRTIGIIYLPPVIAAITCFALLLSLQPLFQNTAGLDIALKVTIASLAAAIPGFFIGMPFPRGMALLGQSNRSGIIPVMWGINGIMSVAGSVLSIILSMFFGFDVALIAGLVIYLAIGLFKDV